MNADDVCTKLFEHLRTNIHLPAFCCFASTTPPLKSSCPQLPLLASQDAMRDTAERIMELERALRESMNTSAHREALWAQEEAARVQAQRQVYL